MKNLDTFSRRILAISISIGIVIFSAAIFLLALSTVSKSYAVSLPKEFIQHDGGSIEGYKIIGVSKGADGEDVAIGFDSRREFGRRIKTFK